MSGAPTAAMVICRMVGLFNEGERWVRRRWLPLLLLTSAGGFMCGVGEMSSCPLSFLTQTSTHPLHDGARWTSRTHQLPDCGQREDLEQAVVRQFQRWWGGCHHLPHLSLQGGA